jgi:hypothetical protein
MGTFWVGVVIKWFLMPIFKPFKTKNLGPPPPPPAQRLVSDISMGIFRPVVPEKFRKDVFV